jgi:hypothetical protein
MRSLPVALAAEVVKEAQYGCYLVQIDLPTVLRFTSLDIPLRYDSKTWEARGFEFKGVETAMSEEIDKMDLSIDNVDHALTNVFHANMVRRKLVWLWYLGLSYPATPVGISLIFNGNIDQVELDHRAVRLEVMSALAYWRKRVPARIYQATCPWIFEPLLDPADIRVGKYCRYAGAETWCDQSYKRCKDLSNSDNFGGFRWLPWLLNRTFKWGPETMD